MSRDVLLQCDGFCVEGADGPIGWVEETWLGPSDEPVALALRLVDGRRGLLPAEDVDRIVPERERVTMRAGARVLELGAPHLVRDGAASWEVTGELVVPPERPALPGQALLELLPRLGDDVLLADPGRPAAAAFLARWNVEELADRVYRLR